MESTLKHWSQVADKLLTGKRIKSVRYMTDNEVADLGWFKRPVVIALDDAEQTVLWVSADDEGNDGGAIHYQSKKESFGVLPTI